MSNDQNASAAQRPLTKREKIINAIPLAIVLVIAVYFAYSCRHSQEVASATNAFVTRYQDLNNDFNQQLRRFLDGEMSPASSGPRARPQLPHRRSTHRDHGGTEVPLFADSEAPSGPRGH